MKTGVSLSVLTVCGTCVLYLQSKKKGLSVEEKRTRMMDFFYEKVKCYAYCMCLI